MKEKVKADKDRIGVTYSSQWDTAINNGEGLFIHSRSGKKYREVNIDTSKHIGMDDRNKY
jgi:hypothetical protein